MTFDSSQTLRTAERHISRGKTTLAIEEYRKLVNLDPSDLNMLNTLGDLYVRVGLTDQARLVFSRVAQGYRHQGFTAKAIAILKKLLRIHPSDIDSAISLAECYVARGLRGDAGRQYAAVADAYKRAGREDKALDTYRRMEEIDPSNTSMPAVESPADVCSAPQDCREHAMLGSASHGSVTHYLSPDTISDDSADLFESAESGDETNDLEPHLTGESLSDTTDSKDSQTDRINQVSFPLEAALHEFVSAHQLREPTSSSRHARSMSDDNPGAMVNDFELLSSDNRRQTTRVPARVPLVVISDTGGWREFTESVDVTAEGLMFQLTHAVLPMTTLRVSIETGKWPENVTSVRPLEASECVVRHCVTRPGKPNLVGVELCPTPDNTLLN